MIIVVVVIITGAGVVSPGRVKPFAGSPGPKRACCLADGAAPEFARPSAGVRGPGLAVPEDQNFPPPAPLQPPA